MARPAATRRPNQRLVCPVPVAYGRGEVLVDADPALADWTVIRPAAEPPHPDPAAAFTAACRQPLGARPLRELIAPTDRVVVVTADGTRPVPNRLLLPWLLAELPVKPEQVTVILGTGTHRANTPAEIAAMFGADLARRVRIINHNGFDPAANVAVGRLPDGTPVRLNRHYVEADQRIALGFIEPHFFAGFSGGAKAVVPGLAEVGLIHRLHNFALIADPACTWGKLAGNPMRDLIEAAVALRPPEFMINVTLNPAKEITAVFAGDHVVAHRAGARHSLAVAMQPVPQAFPLVVTSNSGYPLDQNLYQAVKGMSAAHRITAPGGTMLVCSECADGIPDHGKFAAIMQTATTPAGVLAWIQAQPAVVCDQWQAQLLAQYLLTTAIVVHSRLTAAAAAACQVQTTADVNAELRRRLTALGGRPAVAILPNGPITIPYLRGQAVG